MDVLSDPLATAAIGAVIGSVVTGLVTYFLTAYFSREARTEARRMKHSEELKDKILVPLSRMQISTQSDWTKATFFESRLALDPPGLEKEPVWHWAHAHLRSGYGEASYAWDEAYRLLAETAAELVKTLKATIRRGMAAAVAREFEEHVVGIPTSNPRKMDVYYEDAAVYVITREVNALLAGQRDPPQPLEITLTPLGVGGAYIGSLISHGAYGLARVSRMQDADTRLWQKAIDSVINSEEVREAMRKVEKAYREAEDQLAALKSTLLSVVQKIESGLPIAGECELGY